MTRPGAHHFPIEGILGAIRNRAAGQDQPCCADNDIELRDENAVACLAIGNADHSIADIFGDGRVYEVGRKSNYVQKFLAHDKGPFAAQRGASLHKSGTEHNWNLRERYSYRQPRLTFVHSSSFEAICSRRWNRRFARRIGSAISDSTARHTTANPNRIAPVHQSQLIAFPPCFPALVAQFSRVVPTFHNHVGAA